MLLEGEYHYSKKNNHFQSFSLILYMAMKLKKQRLICCENRMLRMLYGVTLNDGIRSEEIKHKLHIEGIGKVIETQRLRWFGHVLRRPLGNMTRDSLELAGDSYPRGKPRLRWSEIVERDMRKRRLIRADALDRVKWRNGIHERTTR